MKLLAGVVGPLMARTKDKPLAKWAIVLVVAIVVLAITFLVAYWFV